MTIAVDTAQEEQQLVVFELASETYGADIGAVREIIRMQALTKIPQSANYVEGVINLRGAVIPVIDLRKRFGLDWSEEGTDTRILVVEVGRKSIGVIVDAVTEVQRITTAAIETPSSVVLSADSEYVIGIAKVDDKLIILLDLDKALPIEDMDIIEDEDAENAPPFNIELIEQSFAELEPRGEEFVAAFYERLFSNYPEAKPFFADTDMQKQQKKLLSSLVLVVNNIRKPDVLGPVLKKLGKRHAELNVTEEHYQMVGATLLETFSEFMGDKWTSELQDAWAGAYGAIVEGMTA